MRILSSAKWGLIGFIIGLLALVGGALLVPHKVTRAANWLAASAAALQGNPFGQVQPGEPGAIEMGILGIRVSPGGRQPIVVLKEKAGERYLLIGVGLAEANAINIKLNHIDLPRPLTHDLMSSLVNTLGAKVSSVVITDLQQNTFYAKIILRVGVQRREVDSRPSDAIALAIRVPVPIYAAQAVLDKAGVAPGSEGERTIFQPGHPGWHGVRAIAPGRETPLVY